MAEAPRFIDTIADPLKAADVVVGTVALLVGSVRIAALSALSFLLTDQIQKGTRRK